jgi:SAM-dependent methyltransferase
MVRQDYASSMAGQAAHKPLGLRGYGWGGLQLSFSWGWRCPSGALLAHYARHTGRRHLDVGVGTGYFLAHTKFPQIPEITLFDLNPNSLRYTANRIRRYAPHVIQGDVLRSADVPTGEFDSIATNFLFHCLPDGGEGKWRALDHLKPRLARSGVLFGGTIIGDPTAPLARQRRLTRAYNKRGIFCNASDSLHVLEGALRNRFERVEIRTEGVVALFSACG